ncbi:SDR family NAD(P)-dependent oxidoreductase [Furfurilactobacillus siliginis]|uniref:Short-chain dehydrogenase n=1 Tax=Furfurilactobacillus siliginis TaxID=348151 RepID=A0A0R2L2V5_9LACO|nr:SDR family NAD(P)-dependent oxidoreductase [Furfurilactobacillus siliginis]KRN96153.1 hypothetical protein IV55_GL001537 [Furfurilactobacillus siliginis]GEK27923.1 hypothetical protein LSI01_02340 [Furfurilactobacillus siliginis]
MMKQAIIITGATSGMGRYAARNVANDKITILVARNQDKLNDVKEEITAQGGTAETIVCDFSDLASVKRAAAEIKALGLPIVGLANNAGIQTSSTAKSKQGFDLTFATNYLGPFLLTTLLLPNLEVGARVEFTASAVEDPDRKFATRAGFRGSRLVTVADAAQGIYRKGGSTTAGFDAYATSKQCVLAASLVLAKENPALKINALEPGMTLGTNLGISDANAVLKFVLKYGTKPLQWLSPLLKNFSTPRVAGKLISKIVTSVDETGAYFDEKGGLMQPSVQMQDPEYAQEIVAQTRALLQEVEY